MPRWRVADVLTALRVACAALLVLRPALSILIVGVVSDWLDGPLARRSPASSYGARFDLEADSLLTLGAAIAAVRRGAPRVVLLAPVARYVVAALRPHLDRDQAFWDRLTGVAQMAVLAGSIARWPIAVPALVISAARTAALAARMAPRGRLDLASTTGGAPLGRSPQNWRSP
jgi:phosphatidylglycerophosphate synthase